MRSLIRVREADCTDATPDDLPSDTEAEQVTDVRPAHRATPTSCRPASDLGGEAPCYAHLIDEAAAGFRPAESPE